MKRILLIALFAACLTPFTTQASHLAGGEMFYEFTGDAQNPNKYRIWLLFYRDASGIPAPPNPKLCISNSCGLGVVSGTFTTLPFNLMNPCSPNGSINDTCQGSQGSILMPRINDCVDPSSTGNALNIEVHRYYADVVLTGACTDWSFSFSESARNANDNLSSTSYFNVGTKLNNVLGPDNSPVFKTPAIRNFCTNQPTTWRHQALDPDGDSLYYSLEIPLLNDCGNSQSLSTYKPGYSATQPISSVNGLTLDQQGNLNFTPSQPEVVVVKVTVKSFRFHAAAAQWLQNAAVSRDVEVSVLGGCSQSSLNWGLNKPDSIVQLKCGDTTLSLSTNLRFFNSSLAADGSDFAVLNSSGQLVPLIKATPHRTAGSESDSIVLKLFRPLVVNDTLALIGRIGSDNNSLVSACGMEMALNDTIFFYVDNCVDTNSAITENSLPGFEIYPNPAKGEVSLHYLNPSSHRNVILLSSSGKAVLNRQALEIEVTLNLENLPPGVYLLRSQDEEGVQTQKLIKH